MTRETRRSGSSLLLAGVVGVIFFLVTDPRAAARPGADYADAVVHAGVGTIIGIVGSVLTALIGVWLLMRRVV